MSAAISRQNRSRLKRSAWRRIAGLSKRPALSMSMARAMRVGKGRCGRIVDEKSGFVGDHGFERAAASERNDRTAACLRFDGDDAEVFLAGEQCHGGAAIEIANSSSDLSSEKRDILPAAPALPPLAARSSRPRSGPSPTIFSGTLARRQASIASVDALVGDEGRNHESVTAAIGRPNGRGRWREKLGVNGRIHHSRLAIIVSADPARNIMRDSDIAVGAAGRVAVPPSQPGHDVAHDGRLPARPSRSGPK